MKITVEFDVADQETFLRALQTWDETVPNTCNGYRIDSGLDQREALRRFASEMEQKLRRNDHKSGWARDPVDALWRLLEIEIEEFKVLYQYYPVSEARKELLDIANYAMIVWDRLGRYQQQAPAHLQDEHKDRRTWPYARSISGESVRYVDTTRFEQGDKQHAEIQQSLSSGTAHGQHHPEVVRSVDPEPGHSGKP